MPTKSPVLIALAVDTIAYAPVFIAQEAGFFGDLPVEIGVIKPECWHEYGPDRAIEALLQEPVPPLVTVCDPIHALLAAPSVSNRLRIQGIIIKRPFLWVFDSKAERHLRELIASRQLTRVYTQPCRMTADILMRYCLIRSGLSPDDLKRLIVNLDQPDTEARKISQIGGSEAYVSTDLLRLLAAHNKDRTIIFDFADPEQNEEEELLDYPMTALIMAGGDTSENNGNIHSICAALDLALRLISSDPSRALNLLQWHYLARERDRREMSAFYLEPPPPLADELMDFVKPAFRRLMNAGIYPRTMSRDNLSALAQRALDVYSVVYGSQTLIPASSPRDPSFEPFESSQVTVLLDRYVEVLIPAEIPEGTKTRFVETINSLHRISCSDYHVITDPPGTWLCYGNADKEQLRSAIEGIPDLLGNKPRAGSCAHWHLRRLGVGEERACQGYSPVSS